MFTDLDGWVSSDWLTAENLVQSDLLVYDWQSGLHYPAETIKWSHIKKFDAHT